jgi:hypothetical protein
MNSSVVGSAATSDRQAANVQDAVSPLQVSPSVAATPKPCAAMRAGVDSWMVAESHKSACEP